MARSRKKESGQISIMLAMMMMTFIIFFAFVINIGMLVNAKINLQNAADLAAYSGAAVQARQLTHISHLNYEMRRQYKKFIFRYYVIGNMAQQSMSQNSGPRKWSPDGVFDYGAPATCIIFNPNDNVCQLASLKAISIPSKSAMDAINDTLIASLQQIEDLRLKNCTSQGKINKQVLLFWLWNTDPDLGLLSSIIQNNLAMQQEYGKTLSLLKGLNYGLGLIPKEILIRQRIRTLEEYVNTPAQSGLTHDKLRELLVHPDHPQFERSIAAFQTAFDTLGNHTFDNVESIQLDELLPGTTDAAHLLKLNTQNIQFDTFFVDFDPGPAASGQNPQDCRGFLSRIPVNFPLPVGVAKDPSVITYYAIRLKAKAKLMFSPFGDLTLKAYAAARPFGSRIGPPSLGQETLTRRMGPGTIPWLPMNDAGIGWEMQQNILKYYQVMLSQAGGGAGKVVSSSDMERAYQAAMSPNPWEAGRYNIPNDLPDPYLAMVSPRDNMYRIWAPVISKTKEMESGGDIQQIVRKLMEQALSAQSVGGTQILLNDALVMGLSKYVSGLKTGKGEFGESFSFATLSNPIKLKSGQGPAQPFPLTADVYLSAPDKIKTSWKSPKDGDTLQGGRSGYSVKVVAFKEIIQQQVSGNGSDPLSNSMSLDGEADTDLNGPFQH